MNCPQCGAPLDEGAKFCAGCGTAILETPPPAYAPPPPAQPDAYAPPPPSASSYPFNPPQAPVYSNLPPQEDKASGLAIGALVCGILGFCCCGCLTGIPAIIMGFIERGKISRGESSAKGSGFAIAGIVLGVLSILMTILAWIFNIGSILADMN